MTIRNGGHFIINSEYIMISEDNILKKKCPPSVEEVRQKIQDKVEEIIKFCIGEEETKVFFSIEKNLKSRISELGCLFFQLLLVSFHERMDYSK